MGVTPTTVPRVLLSIGDGVVNNFAELSAGEQYKILNTPAPSFPLPKRTDPMRQITLAMRVYGRDSEDVRQNQDLLLEQLNAAVSAGSPYGIGTGVTLGVRFGSAQEWIYFDVLSGEWTVTQEITTQYLTGSLVLTCLPEWRAASYTTSRTAALTCGAGVVFLDGIPGDAPALVQASYVDSGSAVTNHLLIGRYAAPDLEAGDFVPFLGATALGATASDATAFGGSWARVAANSSWQGVCQFAGGSDAAHNAGFFRPFLRVRDYSTSPGTPRFPHASPSTDTGAVPPGAYAFTIVALVGTTAGAASVSAAATLSSTGHIVVGWTGVTGATSYHVYWQQDGGAWQYKNTGSAAISYTFTTITGGTPDQPPTAPSNLPTSIRLRVGLASGLTLLTVPNAQMCRQSGGTPEWLEFPPVWLPPLGLVEGQARQPWLVQAEARNFSGSFNLDIDCACFMPAYQADGASYLTADYPTDDLGTLREWLLDTNRYQVAGGYLRNTGSGAEAGQVFPDGGLTAMPKGFGNAFVFLPVGAGSVSSISELSGAIALTITPRGRALGTGTP